LTVFGLHIRFKRTLRQHAELESLRQADLNLLVVFTVLAEERNVTRAATRLLLSQLAVSRALQRLREMFHDDLLIRSSSGYEPTPKGQRLLHELDQPTVWPFLQHATKPIRQS
jgi:hypothetical protein